MKLEVIAYDDDSGIVTLELDEEAKKWLINRGFNAILSAYVEQSKQEDNGSLAQLD